MASSKLTLYLFIGDNGTERVKDIETSSEAEAGDNPACLQLRCSLVAEDFQTPLPLVSSGGALVTPDLIFR